jgi:hypothetical protein
MSILQKSCPTCVVWDTRTGVTRRRSWTGWVLLGCCAATVAAHAQIDPEKRRLIQLGYNQPLQGRGPISGYAFYYFNEPGFHRTNLTLRLAVAPVYLDSELGIGHALSPRTDLAIGLSGGGFADGYSEVRGGKYLREESFTGHGGEVNASVYHLFNPSQQIPLNGVFRAAGHFSVYDEDDHTDPGFVVPGDRTTIHFRTGLRWGGREPYMSPTVAMEVSAWYEGQYRTDPENYGFANDRAIEELTHSFWARALLIYTLPESKHNFQISLTAGTSANPDRMSAYRIGGALPLSSEFPLTIPGYYYQELSARSFVLFNGQYALPLDKGHQWGLVAGGSAASVDYLQGLEQPGDFHSGVGAGLTFRSKNDVWQIVLGYSYGIEAIRSGGRGAHSVGILIQYDLEADRRLRRPFWDPWLNPLKWRGFDRLFGR